jgi:hypothetical protein
VRLGAAGQNEQQRPARPRRRAPDERGTRRARLDKTTQHLNRPDFRSHDSATRSGSRSRESQEHDIVIQAAEERFNFGVGGPTY